MFSKILKSIIKDSGGSADKVNLDKYMELINHSLIFNPSNHWLGVRLLKNPLDLMILQDIIFEKRPDTIIECGTLYGGSAYYMATLMDLMNIKGKIITIDQHRYPAPGYPKKDLVRIDGKILSIDSDLYQGQNHPKIQYIHSDCLAAKIPETGAKTMVILDCNHSGKHVYKELEKFSPLVSLNQYIIVEDTDAPNKTRGPAAAVDKFLKSSKNFKADKSREKYGISSNLGGYLLKVSE